MPKIKWILREDRWGEEAVDLHTCRKFRVANPEVHDWADDLCVYYLTPDDRWIEEFTESDPENGEKYHGFRWTHPVDVSHDMLWRYHGLPPELEKYRDVASDSKSYYAFMERLRTKLGVKPAEDHPPPRPEWDDENRTLSYGGLTCRVYRREAGNQMAILRAFEGEAWASSIKNPLASEEQLIQACIDINRKLCQDCPIRFRAQGRRISWRVASRRSRLLQ